MNFSELQQRVFTSIILLPIVFFLIYWNKLLFILFLIVITMISIREWFLINKKKFSINVLIGYFVIVLSFFLSFVIRGNAFDSICIFIWIISVCFMSDIGGYFVGKFYGKKRITKISPNKTYAGAFGSCIFSVVPIIVIFIFDLNLPGLSLSFKLILLSLFFSLVCQSGDIIVSYFKRLNKVKNTGNILPGHGGLLDRIDGLIFVMIFSGFLKFINII